MKQHRYYGYLRGKKGAFPKGYVKTIPSDNRLTKWAFEAEHNDELSFPKNVVLECIEKKDEEWSWATYQGKRGALPTSYLGMTVEGGGGGGGGGGDSGGGGNSGTSGSSSSSSSSSGGYVPGSLSSSSYVPGQFSSGPSTEPSYTSSAPSASASAELSPLERARLLLGGVQQASAAADAVTAAAASIARLQAKYDIPSASSSSSSATFSSSSSYAPSSNSMKALADFRGEAEDELTFRKGDEIIFVRKHDNEWSIGETTGKGGRRGMYPSNFAR